MKNLKRFFISLVVILGSISSSQAQVVDSSVVHPANPGPNDTIKIYTYTTFNSGPCFGSATSNQSGFNIGASALHCMGALAVICHDIDTVILNPPHNLGNYTYAYVLSAGFGGPPCSPGIVPSDYDTINFTVGNPPPPPANIPPTISSYAGDSVCENDTLGPITFMLTDEDLNGLIVSATSSNQSVISNTGLILSGSGNSRDLLVVPVINQTGNANIKVMVIDTGGKKDSAMFNVKVYQCSTATGVANIAIKEYSLFPNPATTNLTVKSPRHRIHDVMLYNSIGELIEVESQGDKHQVNLDLSNLSRGAYVVQVNLGGNRVYRSKVLLE